MGELREKVARQICAFSHGKCCDSEAAPCKVGRGEAFNGTNCGATLQLLESWGHTEEARRILAIPEIRDALDRAKEMPKTYYPAGIGRGDPGGCEAHPKRC